MRLLQAGDPKHALEKLPRSRPSIPSFLNRGHPGTALSVGQSTAPARQELERAVTDNPDAPEPYLLFGELAMHEQRLTDAQCLLDHAWTISQASTATPIAEGLVRPQPGRTGRVAEQRGQWQQAIDHLNAWEKLDSKNGIVHQRIGRALFQLKKYQASLRRIAAGAKEEKKLLPAEIVMAQLYQAAGDHKSAAKYIDQAIKNSPDDLPTRLAAAEWAPASQ